MTSLKYALGDSGEVYTFTHAQTFLNLHRQVLEFVHFVERVKKVAAVFVFLVTNGIQHRGAQYLGNGRFFLTIEYVVMRCTTVVLVLAVIDDDGSTVQTIMGLAILAKHGRTATCSA
jgi:hypothetical protein